MIMNPTRQILAIFLSLAALLNAGDVLASDASKKEARVTQIIRDVELLPSASAVRPAVVDEKVGEGTAVRTGDESRSELTFVDLTITRLGANTIFSFTKAGRKGELEDGSILLCVPKDSGGARVTTPAVTAGITGTTVILEAARSGRSKFTILEGGGRLTLNKYPSESGYIHAGQMYDVPAGAAKLPPPVNVDLNQIMKTSPLITDFPPLPSQRLILEAAHKRPSSNQTVYQGRPAGAPVIGLPAIIPSVRTPWRWGNANNPPDYHGGKPSDHTSNGKPGGHASDGKPIHHTTGGNATGRTSGVTTGKTSKQHSSPTPTPRGY